MYPETVPCFIAQAAPNLTTSISLDFLSAGIIGMDSETWLNYFDGRNMKKVFPMLP